MASENRRRAIAAVAWRFLILVLGLGVPLSVASADATTWQHEPGTPGDWFVPENWTAGLPDQFIDAHVANGGTAEISAGQGYTRDLYVERGALVQSGVSRLQARDVHLDVWPFPGTATYTLRDAAHIDALLFFIVGSGARMTQLGGTLEAWKLEMDGGAYEFRGGTLTGVAGVWMAGAFTQDGGLLDAHNLFVADGGIYTLISGTMGPYSLDMSGASSRLVVQGGVANVNEMSGGDGATATFSGGSFHAGEFDVGDHYYDQGLNLEITSPSANVSAGTLTLLRLSRLSAVAGSHITVTGELVNQNTDSSALAGLANLNLIIAGGAGLVRVEVAGKDLGAVPAGWTDNFALSGLTLGDTAPGKVRLVNGFDNQPGFSGADALYVDNLVLNPGAAVDLNGLNLYYRNGGAAKKFFVGDAFLDGDVDFADYQALETHFGATTGAAWADGDFDGDGNVDFADYSQLEVNFGWQTPEPGSLALLAIGLATLTRRGRKSFFAARLL